MKKKLLLLSCSVLSLLALPAAQTTTAAPAAPAASTVRAAFPDEYSHGFYDGQDDATANKCNYRNSPGAYETWYYQARQDALDYMNRALQYGDQEAADFWSGYYNGLESGYYTQVVCTGGGGTGGGGPLTPPPYVP